MASSHIECTAPDLLNVAPAAHSGGNLGHSAIVGCGETGAGAIIAPSSSARVLARRPVK